MYFRQVQHKFSIRAIKYYYYEITGPLVYTSTLLQYFLSNDWIKDSNWVVIALLITRLKSFDKYHSWMRMSGENKHIYFMKGLLVACPWKENTTHQHHC